MIFFSPCCLFDDIKRVQKVNNLKNKQNEKKRTKKERTYNQIK